MLGGGQVSLELVIDRADVAAVLTALSDGSALSVVPSNGVPSAGASSSPASSTGGAER